MVQEQLEHESDEDFTSDVYEVFLIPWSEQGTITEIMNFKRKTKVSVL